MTRTTNLVLLAATIAGLGALTDNRAFGDDWPQWLGPRRDSVWRETGIVKKFPEKGLPIKWRKPVALGYAGPAVANGRVYVADFEKLTGDISNSPGGRDDLEGHERVVCFDADTGNVAWTYKFKTQYKISYPSGPRCTPTVDAGKVYALGAQGHLVCLDAESGEKLWEKSFTDLYKVETPVWGFTSHPLVDGDLLICVVGGDGSEAVAFDKNTGREVWKALSSKEPGYCPPTLIEHAGKKQLLIWDPSNLNSLDPKTGTVYWTTPLKPNYSMTITAPRQHGDLLFASGIGRVGALYTLTDADGKPGVKEVWRGKNTTAVYCANSTPFIEADTIYGCDCDLGALMGVDLKTGKRLWETFVPTSGGTRRAGHGTAFIVKHANGYFLFSETGDLILAELSPKEYKEQSRFHVLEPTNDAFGRKVVWSHPAFAERCLFARNDKELVCVDLSAEQ